MGQHNRQQNSQHDDAVGKSQRDLQSQQAAADRRRPRAGESSAMQAGARSYPAPPFPEQHQAKPGDEWRLNPQPMYDAPFHQGSDKLKDKVAIVTGADSGIGRAVATLFAREGADVVVMYLQEDRDADETRRAVEPEGRRCLLLRGDVAGREFCEHAIAETLSTFGQVDVLVNNAAFQLHVSDFQELSEAQFARTMKTNLYGYFHLCQLAAKHMQPGSAIVNTSSVTGILGNSRLLDYSLTKGGINAFTRSLATHLVPKAIRVNSLAPGPVWTPLNAADADAEKVSEFGGDVPVKRPAQPEEIAPAYVFLASPPCSSYITGEILPIIGGYSGG